MAAPTNHLTSHCGEHRSYPADKMIPKSVMKGHKPLKASQNTEPAHMKTWLPCWRRRRRADGYYARAHNRRSRRYMLQQARREADEVSLRSSVD